MNIKESLSYAANKLQSVGIISANLEARILLQHATDRSIEYLLARFEEELPSHQQIIFGELVDRRSLLEPIAYIIKSREFYGHEFIISDNVLIPRQDTEILIDAILAIVNSGEFHTKNEGLASLAVVSRHANFPKFCEANSSKQHNDIYLNDLENWNVKQEVSEYSVQLVREHAIPAKFCETNSSKQKNISILDLGTGSGCIVISLLLEIPNARAVASDVSNKAINIASQNGIKHQVSDRLQLINSNWFENLEPQQFDIIVSNPPYIAGDDIANMASETLRYEPHLALFAENNGLAAYELIAKSARKFLKPSGKLFLEIGFNQSDSVRKIFTNYDYNIKQTYKDLAGHDRGILVIL